MSGTVSFSSSSSTTAPTLTISNKNGIQESGQILLSGTIDVADKQLQVMIYDGAMLLGTVQPASDGSWSKSFPLGLGFHSLTAQAVNGSQQTGVSAPAVVVVATTDNPPLLYLTTGQLTTVAALLAGNATVYALDITDSAANISVDLDALETNAAELRSISVSDPNHPITLTAAQFNQDKSALKKIVGAHSLLVTGVAGQAYTSYQLNYDDLGVVTTKEFFYPATSQPFTSFDYVYSAGNALIGSKFFYAAPQGANYASSEYDYNGGGGLTRIAISGVSGQPYSAYEYDFNGSSLTGSKFVVTSVPNGAAYSSYELDYNAANVFVGTKFFFDLPGNFAYQHEEEDFDASASLVAVNYSGVMGQAYSALDEQFWSGRLTGYKIYYTNVLNAVYTAEELDVSAAGAVTRAAFEGFKNTPYSGIEENFQSGALVSVVYDFTLSSGGNAYAYQVTESAQGAVLQTTYDNVNGTHTTIGAANSQTLQSLGNDKMTGGGSQETFVLNPYFGHDKILDLGSHLSGAGHDTVELFTTDFTNFSAMLAATSDVSGSAVITAADGDQLTLSGITKSEITANPSDFVFVPVALAPSLSVANATTTSGKSVVLDITASQAASYLTASDLTISITGLQGATLNQGTLNADGSWTLTAAQLAGLSLTSAANFTGDLALSVKATDAESLSQSTASSTQTLDVKVESGALPTAPAFDLSNTDKTGAANSHTTSSSNVTLVGKTDPGDTVKLMSTGQTTIANTAGAFEFDNVHLSAGANPLTVTATDAAGSTSYNLTVQLQSATSSTNPVLAWNQTTLAAIALDADAPTVASRALAMESLAVYDAVAAINGTPGYLFNLTAASDANATAAIAEAADTVLDHLYPAQSAAFDAQLAAELATVAAGQGKTDGIALGQQAGLDILALRANDGADDVVVDTGDDAVGQWRPTAPGYANATTPQWANVTPFALTSPDQFLPAGPPALTSAAYAAAVNETKSLGEGDSTTRTADETQIALYWNDPTGTYTPAGQWNAIADQMAGSSDDSLAQDAQMLAVLNVAEADSGIARLQFEIHLRRLAPYHDHPERQRNRQSRHNPGRRLDAAAHDPFLPRICRRPRRLQ